MKTKLVFFFLRSFLFISQNLFSGGDVQQSGASTMEKKVIM